MSFIKILLSFIILFPITKNFYMLKYGHIIMNYYEYSECTGNKFDQVVISVPENEEFLTILNNENNIVNYSYFFDYFSSQISYTNSTGEDDDDEEGEDENIYTRAFMCNGNCYTRLDGSDILINPGEEISENKYEELNSKYKGYSCIYNNIIKTATIEIERYSDKKCKNKITDYLFKGEEYCWKIENNYSLRPLYYEDGNKQIYYHAYNSNDCTNKFFEYFTINQNYIKCDKKCNADKTEQGKYYKCKFNANNDNYINLKKIILLLYLILMF